MDFLSNIESTEYNEKAYTLSADIANAAGLVDFEATSIEEVFKKYTSYHHLVRMKTMNMGSLYKLTYDVKIKNGVREKDFLDEMGVWHELNMHAVNNLLKENGIKPIKIDMAKFTESWEEE